MDADYISRFNGTGAPTYGTWPTGHVGVDSAGAIWICTAGGTPGTWTLVSGSGGGVSSFNTRTGAVTLAKGDVTGTGIAAADISATPASRLVSTGSGLTGGGDLSADRTLSIDTTAANTWTAVQTATALAATLSGTTGRFVGVLTAAPGSGTFNTGDFGIDSTNKQIWVCTAGGTPGTWASFGSGGGGSGLTKIARTVLASAAASIDFSNIPQTYESLIVEFMGRGDTAATNVNVLMTFNGDSGSNYDASWIYTEGSSALVGKSIAGANFGGACIISAASDTSGAASAFRLMVPNYARTTFRKVFFQEGFLQNASDGSQTDTWKSSGQWRSTASLTEVTFTASAGNFIAGTVASIYGVS